MAESSGRRGRKRMGDSERGEQEILWDGERNNATPLPTYDGKVRWGLILRGGETVIRCLIISDIVSSQCRATWIRYRIAHWRPRYSPTDTLV